MMTLGQASGYFDRTPVYDGDTGALLFKAQLDVYDDTKRDAHTAYRRILSVRPGTSMPSSRVVTVMGKRWVVGGMEPDGLADPHREKYVLAQADTRLRVSNLAQYLAGAYSREMWCAPYWSKDAKQTETSSAHPQFFDVIAPDAVDPQSVLWAGDEAYLVQSPRPMPSGLHAAFSLRLATQLEDALVANRVYSPAAGAYVESVSTAYQALRVRWQSLFDYGSQADERYQEGDVSVVLPQASAVTTSSTVTVGGFTHGVMSVDQVGGALVAHCRRL